jgi:Ribbon-helix-helix protein, copG family
MPKVRTTLTIDEDVLRAVKLRAAVTGEGESKLIEDAVRRDFGLDTLKNLWASVEPMAEAEAMDLALEAQQAARKRSGSQRR